MLKPKPSTNVQNKPPLLTVPRPTTGKTLSSALKTQNTQSSKIPSLKEVLDQWKFQQKSNHFNLDQSLRSSHTIDDSITNYIQHLTRKIEQLQNQLLQLQQKHIEVCKVLKLELSKNKKSEEILRKENYELNYELKSLMTKVKYIFQDLAKNPNNKYFGQQMCIKVSQCPQNSPFSNMQNRLEERGIPYYRQKIVKKHRSIFENRMHSKSHTILQSSVDRNYIQQPKVTTEKQRQLDVIHEAYYYPASIRTAEGVKLKSGRKNSAKISTNRNMIKERQIGAFL